MESKYREMGARNPFSSDKGVFDCASVQEVFEYLGFDVDVTTNGNDVIALSSYDNKMSNEELFLVAVAPFVKDGSFLEWMGDDHQTWRQEVKAGVLLQSVGKATITYGKYRSLRYDEYCYDPDCSRKGEGNHWHLFDTATMKEVDIKNAHLN